MKHLIPATLAAFLLVSPLAIAEEAHHPDSGTTPAETPTTPESTPAGTETQSATPAGMGMGGSDMMSGQQGSGMTGAE